MSDTPFRTDRFKRFVPYIREQLNDVAAAQVKEATGMTPEQLVEYSNNPRNNPKYWNEETMYKLAPWVEPLIKDMVDARLSMYNSDEPWADDKSYGWIQGLAERPQSELFQIYRDANDGHLWAEPTEAGMKLFQTDPEIFEAAKQNFVKSNEDFGNKAYTLRPGKKEEAGESEAWWPTTDAIADAITAKIGEGFASPLSTALHNRFMDVMKEDLARPNPQYLNAMKKRLLPDFDYEKGNPTYEDLVNSQLAKHENWFDRDEFVRPKSATTFVGNTVAPLTTSALADQERYHKTGGLGFTARGVGDAGMLVASAYSPLKGAKIGSAIGDRVPFLFNTGSKVGAYLGGAGGGAANYILDRAVDAGFDAATGLGGADYPMTGTDLATAAVLGAVGGRPMVKHMPYGKFVQKMGGTQPELVTRADVLAMKKAGQKQKDLVAEGKGRVGKEGIERYYLDDAFAAHRKAYPNEVAMRDSFDPIFDDAGVPLVTNAPGGKVSQTTYIGPRGIPLTVTKGRGNKAMYLTERDINRTPVAREKMDAEISQQYFDRPEFADWGVDEKADLVKAANAARERGSEFSQYFTGRKELMKGTDIAAEKRRWRGQNKYGEKIPGNKAILRLYDDDNLTYGIQKNGKFVPETKAQSDSRAAANKVKHRRYDHDVVTNAERRSEIAAGSPRGVAGIAANLVLQRPIPVSNYIGGVVPYTYEPYPKKEK